MSVGEASVRHDRTDMRMTKRANRLLGIPSERTGGEHTMSNIRRRLPQSTARPPGRCVAASNDSIILEVHGPWYDESELENSSHKLQHPEDIDYHSDDGEDADDDPNQAPYNRIADDSSNLVGIVTRMRSKDRSQCRNVHFPGEPSLIADVASTGFDKKLITFDYGEHAIYYAFNHEDDGGWPFTASLQAAGMNTRQLSTTDDEDVVQVAWLKFRFHLQRDHQRALNALALINASWGVVSKLLIT